MPVGASPGLSRGRLLTWRTGQSSRNKLIVFADGTYLELFCWLDSPREFHAWANKSPGLIDFALTSLPPSTAQSLHMDIMSRLREKRIGDVSEVKYTLPAAGGRSNQDAVQVKWESSRPVSTESVDRTDFPFFCHDVTPRNVRVPFDDSEKTRHPCGAVGISAIEVIVPKSRSGIFTELYVQILGATPRISDKHAKGARLDFELGSPVQGFGLSTMSLCSEEEEIDQIWLRDRGAGIHSLVLSVEGHEGHGEKALGTEGIPSTISLKW